MPILFCCCHSVSSPMLSLQSSSLLILDDLYETYALHAAITYTWWHFVTFKISIINHFMDICNLTSYKDFSSIYSKPIHPCAKISSDFSLSLFNNDSFTHKETQTKVKGLILDPCFTSTQKTSGHQILLILFPICQSFTLLLSRLSLT